MPVPVRLLSISGLPWKCITYSHRIQKRFGSSNRRLHQIRRPRLVWLRLRRTDDPRADGRRNRLWWRRLAW